MAPHVVLGQCWFAVVLLGNFAAWHLGVELVGWCEPSNGSH